MALHRSSTAQKAWVTRIRNGINASPPLLLLLVLLDVASPCVPEQPSMAPENANNACCHRLGPPQNAMHGWLPLRALIRLTPHTQVPT